VKACRYSIGEQIQVRPPTPQTIQRYDYDGYVYQHRGCVTSLPTDHYLPADVIDIAWSASPSSSTTTTSARRPCILIRYSNRRARLDCNE
jgi:hypothetical protein